MCIANRTNMVTSSYISVELQALDDQWVFWHPSQLSNSFMIYETTFQLQSRWHYGDERGRAGPGHRPHVGHGMH
jgi:hypothetical protein